MIVLASSRNELYAPAPRFTHGEYQVFVDDLEARAREFSVFDLTDFYASPAFRNDGFSLDAKRRTILRQW